MFFILGIILAVAWLVGYVVLHVASSMIHFLLVLGIIGVVIHFVRGGGAMRAPTGRLG